MSSETVLGITDLEFGYEPGKRLLHIPSFNIERGESVFLRGPSGSGKSTLLSLIGGILTPDQGEIHICDSELSRLSSAKRDQLRADHLGIVFQQFNLLPYLSVLQNCVLPCRFSSKRADAAKAKHGDVAAAAKHLLKGLGLEEGNYTRSVSDLSVGQQQRVAVARALIGGPDLIIADEPTSALDHDNRDRFIELLHESREQYGSSLLFVSHDQSLAKQFKKSVALSELNKEPAYE